VKKIKVAIVGVGNCASSLVQGLVRYEELGDGDAPGIMHASVGGYCVDSIEVVAAFDVDSTKVGRDVSVAIDAGLNNTHRFAEVPFLGVTVSRGPTLDGLGRLLAAEITESDAPVVDVAAVLVGSGADVLLNFLPVGARDATRWYMERALSAKVGVVNCIPEVIASSPEWDRRFARAGLPLIGDDVKSQVGATMVHRALTNLFEDRGVQILRTYQLNFGGNADFLNMLDRDRSLSKKESKTAAVTSQMAHQPEPYAIHIGPSDYVPWLGDSKWSHIRIEGKAFGDVPLNIEVKLEVTNSTNSAGVVIDAIRCCKLAMDRGISGALREPCAYFMKAPPVQCPDDIARDMVERFIHAPDPGVAGRGR
jgi:myo-inositol-1-phosphate synthase